MMKVVQENPIPPVLVSVGSFATKETTPIIDIKAKHLISERAVYGHCESEVVNMQYSLMAKNVRR